MPQPDPLSEPWIRTAIGSTWLAVLVVVLFVVTILDKLASAAEKVSRIIRDWIDWRDRRRHVEPTPRVVPLSGPSEWVSGASGSLAAGHTVVSGSAGIGRPVVMAAEGRIRVSGTAG
jgi:hypothetical protein